MKVEINNICIICNQEVTDPENHEASLAFDAETNRPLGIICFACTTAKDLEKEK